METWRLWVDLDTLHKRIVMDNLRCTKHYLAQGYTRHSAAKDCNGQPITEGCTRHSAQENYMGKALPEGLQEECTGYSAASACIGLGHSATATEMTNALACTVHHNSSSFIREYVQCGIINICTCVHLHVGCRCRKGSAEG
jgi:hypothetical protein